MSNAAKAPSESMLRAYQLGQRDPRVDDLDAFERTVECYGVASPEALFHECGCEGREMPEWVKGWRLGDLPEHGRSYNHRDDRPEPGVSVMGLNGDDETDGTFAIFNRAGRNVIKVSGWLHFRRGSDGEPLLVGAEVIV